MAHQYRVLAGKVRSPRSNYWWWPYIFIFY